MSHIGEIPIWQVDAFANRPFTGNPAAVCVLKQFPSDTWMQNVAAEMNLSETAFVVPRGVTNTFDLRWFTPATEVDLCGHATLATAHVLFEQNLVGANEAIRFQTRSGELVCARSDTMITLDFPATPANEGVSAELSNELLKSLAVKNATVLQTAFDLVVVCDDEKTVKNLSPDFNSLSDIDTRGVMVTAPSKQHGVDFVSRFFAPRCGINEDPVTGSAHCCLSPYWAEKLGKTSLVGYQGSSRGGLVRCDVDGHRVKLAGKAITVMEGKLLTEMR